MTHRSGSADQPGADAVPRPVGAEGAEHAAVAVARLARSVVGAATRARLTLATAESLTGGAVSAALVAVPGASVVYRGGLVTYATDLKRDWLGVDPTLLDVRGPVDADVARAMAAGVRLRAGADIGIATTGVAGPGPADGHPAGTVHVCAGADHGVLARQLLLSGDRDEVRIATVHAALAAVLDLIESSPR